MTRTQRTCALGVILSAFVLAGTACGASGGSDATEDPRPSTTAISQPVGDPPENEIVWQETTGGGFVPQEFAAGGVPAVTIYADGRILVQVGQPDGGFGGPAVLEQAQVPADALADFLAKADATGLFEPGTDFGSPGITDQPSTTVTLRADGPPRTVSVYALGFEFPDAQPGGITAEQSERRAALEELMADARSLAGREEPYEPDRVKASLFDPTTGASTPTSGQPWPGPPLSSFPAPTAGDSRSCLVIEGDDARAVYAAAQDNPEMTWELDGEVRTIVIAPLLPGQEGCPPS